MRRRLGPSVLAVVWIVGAAFPASAQGPASGSPSAPGERELEVARSLFAEALADEEAGSFHVASEKYRRVASVRDTAPVRFRLGRCLEGMGRRVAALGEYRSAITLGEKDPGQVKVVRAARERVAEIESRVSHVTLHLTGPAPGALSVDLDGAPADAEQAASPGGLVVDAGTHALTVRRGNQVAFAGQVTVPEGGHVAVEVPAARVAPVGADVPTGDGKTILPPAGAADRGPWPAVALGGAGALAAAAVACFLVRELDARALVDACPGGLCPTSRRDELEGIHGRAEVMLPVGLVLSGLSLAAAGVGTYLLVAPAGGAPGKVGGVTTSASPGPLGATVRWAP